MPNYSQICLFRAKKEPIVIASGLSIVSVCSDDKYDSRSDSVRAYEVPEILVRSISSFGSVLVQVQQLGPRRRERGARMQLMRRSIWYL